MSHRTYSIGQEATNFLLMFIIVAISFNTALGPGKYFTTIFMKELKEGR